MSAFDDEINYAAETFIGEYSDMYESESPVVVLRNSSQGKLPNYHTELIIHIYINAGNIFLTRRYLLAKNPRSFGFRYF